MTIGIVEVAFFAASGEADSAGRNNHHGLQADEIGRERRQLTQLIIGPAEFDRDVPALDEASVSQALMECSHGVPVHGE